MGDYKRFGIEKLYEQSETSSQFDFRIAFGLLALIFVIICITKLVREANISLRKISMRAYAIPMAVLLILICVYTIPDIIMQRKAILSSSHDASEEIQNDAYASDADVGSRSIEAGMRAAERWDSEHGIYDKKTQFISENKNFYLAYFPEDDGEPVPFSLDDVSFKYTPYWFSFEQDAIFSIMMYSLHGGADHFIVDKRIIPEIENAVLTIRRNPNVTSVDWEPITISDKTECYDFRLSMKN